MWCFSGETPAESQEKEIFVYVYALANNNSLMTPTAEASLTDSLDPSILVEWPVRLSPNQGE